MNHLKDTRRHWSKIAALLLILLMTHKSQAQQSQRPVITQYMFSGLILNPAYAGDQKQTVATLMHRDQWVNFDGSPKTQTLIVNSALKEYPVGVGLLLSRDQIGSYEDYSVYSSYSYRIPLTAIKSSLSFGLQAGFNYTGANYDKLNRLDPDDPIFVNRNRFKPNFGMGMFLSNKTSYAGVSIPYILSGDTYSREEVATQVQRARYLFLTGGHVFKLTEFIKFKPSTLIRLQQGQALTADLNVNVFLDDILNIGASYRSQDSFIGLFELILNPNFSVGYSYDMTTSQVAKFSDGTHEFMLKYRRNLGKGPCHAYF